MAPVAAARGHWRMGIGMFTARPKLAAALGAGVAVSAACFLLVRALSGWSSFIAGWDTFCVVYLGLAFHALAGKGPAEIRQQAAREDQGQAVILVLILAACATSVVAAGVNLSIARDVHGEAKWLHIAAAVVTVTASWLVMQVIFAVHYAHEYYAADPETRKDAGGLAFPGGEPPDYWDFLHFSMVIGVAAQTADIAFTQKGLRRVGTVHSLIAFAFNTLIVALTINLVASLF
jgi:uncharacterized membrane protein